MPRRAPQVIVRHPGQWGRRLVLIMFVMLAVGAVGWWAYQLGRSHIAQAAADALAMRAHLEAENARLSEQGKRLRARATRAESAQRIDEFAYETVRGDLRQLQQENAGLQQELQFYRSVLAPTADGNDLRVQDFTVQPTAKPGRYHFRLTLIRMRGGSDSIRKVSGRVSLDVEGRSQGAFQRLEHETLITGDGEDFSYTLKYYKTFSGEMTLPAGFAPELVVVKVKPKRGSNKSTAEAFETEFQWASVLAVEGLANVE